ncbi:MAG: arginine--tRNA ligase [Actinobacteria bacterium]|nr:arginine--tRNA ligase [Actinomycetota bacterium]MBU1943390.1 arginine--tRNA ligase [Actinomycetota bacterium]MBU2686747.1 arginine--tRNA ligase [Actinomycetota bacterium]
MSREKIVELIEGAVAAAVEAGEIPPVADVSVALERPKRLEHGDWATNLALVLAKHTGARPRQVAEALARHIEPVPGVVSCVEVAGPGFINFRLAPEFVRGILFEIDARGDGFASSDAGGSRRVQVEFVSANPVGPLHVGHGRWAAYGDALVRVMERAGFDVQREFYVNDYGTQVANFGRSISARYMEALGREATFPESGYAGRYIVDIADRIVEEHGEEYADLPDEERSRLFADAEYPRMLESIRATCERMGVGFDVWFSERELYRKGEVERTLAELEERGEAYRSEGALWLKTSEYGDEKDRVLVRSNGEPTYFASDIAYHHDKMLRGFDLVIDIWGADHHGYVARMKAAMDAMGYGAEHLEVILGHLVRLYRAGEPVVMSKRTGDIITLDELLDEVGPDAARYFFLQRTSDSPLDLDIDLARKESPENPVYYVQYAHARICSILRFAAEQGAGDRVPSPRDVALLDTAAEMDLIRKLAELEETVVICARQRAPHRLTKYAEELAALFHVFYRDCRVVTEDEGLTAARMFLVKGVRRVLKITLGLLGVSAPDSM